MTANTTARQHDSSDIPREEIQVDAVDLSPKNFKEISEYQRYFLFEQVKQVKQVKENLTHGAMGRKMCQRKNVHNVNSIDEIVEVGHGIYILDDIRE